MKNFFLTIMLLLFLSGCTAQQYNYNESSDTVANDIEMKHSNYYQNQQSLKEDYKNDILNNEYDLDNPWIKINPWDANTLSAYVAFTYEEPVTFEYTVEGKDEESNFVYTSQKSPSKNVLIPVMGLYYGENTVDITLEKNGKIVEEKTISIDTSDQVLNEDETIAKDMLTQNVASTNDKANEMLQNGFILVAGYEGYDLNGDLRFDVGMTRKPYNKAFNNSLYTASEDGNYIYKTDAMGVIKTEYKFPDGEESHHDFATDGKGNLYALGGTAKLEDSKGNHIEGTNAETQIVKFNDETGELIKDFNVYQYFEGNPVVASGLQYDPIHINSINYDEDLGLFMSSQAEGMIFSVDPETFELKWIIDEKDDIKTNQNKVLQVVGDDFIHTSGQHSVVINENPKYNNQRDEGKIVISVFNNNVCKDADGNEYKTDVVNGPFEKKDVCAYFEDQKHEYEKSQMLVYAIDLDSFTVEMLDSFELPRYAPITSNVNTFPGYTDYYQVFMASSSIPTYVIMDKDGNIIYKMEITNAWSSFDNYRGNYFSSEMLAQSMV